MKPPATLPSGRPDEDGAPAPAAQSAAPGAAETPPCSAAPPAGFEATERRWILPSGGRVIIPYSVVEGGTVTGTDAIVGDILVTAGMDVEALLVAKCREACQALRRLQRGEE